MAIDMFKTRTMITMLREMKPPRTFLRDTFFPNRRPFDTEYVDIDLVKGKRRMAPFVAPRIGGKTVERLGYTTQTYRPPLVAPDMITTAEDAMKRAPGENVYSPLSPAERMAEQLGRDMAELDELITRREEWMCAQALFTGQIHMTGEGVDETVTFGLTHDEVADALWSAAESKPLDDLRTIRRTCVQDCGLAPDVVVMGSSAIDAFLDHDQVQKMMDLRRVDMGQIVPSQLPNGVTYYGFVRDVGMDIYGYDEWYLDDDGVEQPMVPANKILAGSTRARTELLYGAIVEADTGESFALPRVPKSWTQPKPSARFVALKSRPLPVPVQIDAFYVLQVLAA